MQGNASHAGRGRPSGAEGGRSGDAAGAGIGDAAGEPITVAHLVTPYLFPTGSWIHAQLVHSCGVRPIVLTQKLADPGAFPFSPIFEVTQSLGRLGRMRNGLRSLSGGYDPRPYLPILRQQGAALLHAHLGWEGALALPVARASGLPMIVSFYGRDAGRLPRFPWWRARFQRLFREAQLFLVEGPALAARLRDIGCPGEKVRVLHLGIDPARIPFRERSGEAGRPVEILVSASFRPKKGVPSAVRAFAGVAAEFPHARLRVLGDGPERTAVMREVRRANLGERIVLEGYVRYARHLRALEEADLFLAPSRTAPDGDTEGGAPVAVIEAQAAGLPVVSTTHADIPEVVIAGEGGLLSPEGDDAALAKNLASLLSRPETWPAMGRSARARIEREFDIRALSCEAARIYRETARRGDAD